MVNELIKLANALDEEGFSDEADQIDELIEESYSTETPDDEIYDDISLEVVQDDIEYAEEVSEVESDYNGEWSIYRGELTSPSGHTLQVKKIRQGSFSRVYEIASDPENMLVNTRDDVYEKEILSGIHTEQLSLSPDEVNPHIPQVREIGYAKNGKLYIMKKYKMPLRKSDSEDWSDYLSVRKCWLEAQDIVRNRYNKRGVKIQYYHLGNEIFNETVDCAIKNNVKVSIVEALEMLRDQASMYGSEYGFEISPRNVGTDEYGNLVLVDVLFNMKEMHKMR